MTRENPEQGGCRGRAAPHRTPLPELRQQGWAPSPRMGPRRLLARAGTHLLSLLGQVQPVPPAQLDQSLQVPHGLWPQRVLLHFLLEQDKHSPVWDGTRTYCQRPVRGRETGAPCEPPRRTRDGVAAGDSSYDRHPTGQGLSWASIPETQRLMLTRNLPTSACFLGTAQTHTGLERLPRVTGRMRMGAEGDLQAATLAAMVTGFTKHYAGETRPSTGRLPVLLRPHAHL